MQLLGSLLYFMYKKKRQQKGPPSPDLLLDLHKTKHSTCANCSAELNEVKNLKFECINPAKQKWSFIKDNAYVVLSIDYEVCWPKINGLKVYD